MLYLSLPVSMLEVLIVAVPILLSVAFVTIAESKTMASMQSSLGPNIVGYYGLLQAFADALKLLMKEYVSPTQANLVLFFLGPVMTLIFSLLGFAVMPYGPGLAVFDFDLGILYFLAVSSLATYGMLLAGWSANSKYAFLGSLSSTAQLMSYELVLTSAMLMVMLLTSSLSLTVNIESQSAVWFLMPLFPLFMMFFMSCVAETNSAPFDLAEAESELVSGFMTEHSAVMFVFFFLAEYASLVLMCIMVTVLFMGGYNMNLSYMNNLYYMTHCFLMDLEFLLEKLYYYMLGYSNSNETTILSYNEAKYFYHFRYELPLQNISSYLSTAPMTTSCLYGLVLGIKSILMVFVFIWMSASFPSMSFDQLMSYSWTVLLPLVFAFIIALPVLTNIMDLIPSKDLM